MNSVSDQDDIEAGADGGGPTVDTGTIAWLLPEIANAFDAATAALRSFRAGAAGVGRLDVDLAPLRVARSHVHQAHGALQLGEVAGVTALTEAVEDLLVCFEKEPERCDAIALDAIIGGCRAIVEYLEDLQAGARQQPLHLFPSYRDLLTARGVDRIHPADLFVVDLGIRAPRGDDATPLSSDSLREQRGAFEQGLLRYIRNENDTAALTALCRAVTMVDGAVASGPKNQGQHRAFWWATRALFEALANGGFAKVRSQHPHLKRLAGRVNLQIRKLVEGSTAVAERLFTDTLFFVAMAEPVTSHVRAVQARYGLVGAVPTDFEAQRYGRIDPAQLRAARDALTAAKMAWSAIVAGDVGQIRLFAKEAAAVVEAARPLKRRGLALVAQVIDGIATDLDFDPRQPPATVGLDVATALLFLEGALERARSLDEAFDARAALVVARVEASVLGQDNPSPTVDWLDRMSREAEERLTMATFVAELQANLRTAEKVLDGFFRDPTDRAGLKDAQKALAQASGALSLLGHADVHQAIDRARQSIARFEVDGSVVDDGAFAELANNLGAVGFYIDQIKRERIDTAAFRFDSGTGRFDADMARVPAAVQAARDAEAAPSDGAARTSASPVPEAVESIVDVPKHDPFAATDILSSLPDDGDTPRVPEVDPFAATDVFFAATQVMEPEIDGSLEDEIVARAADAQAHAARLREQPDDETVRGHLVAAVDDVRRSAMLIDDRALQDEAAGVLETLRDGAHDPLGFASAAELADRVTELAFHANRSVGTAGPTPSPVEPSVPVPSEDNTEAIDAELLEIFLEEAGVVLLEAEASLRVLDGDPSNATATVNLRRGFHTLKGSGRMVGLMALGDAAWSIEDALNEHIAGQQAASADLRSLIDYAIRYLVDWVEELRASGRSSRIPDALIEAAKRATQNSRAAPPTLRPFGALDTLDRASFAPATVEPVATVAVVTEPAVTEPAAMEPEAAEPARVERFAVEPVAAEPEAIVPMLLQPLEAAGPIDAPAPVVEPGPFDEDERFDRTVFVGRDQPATEEPAFAATEVLDDEPEPSDFEFFGRQPELPAEARVDQPVVEAPDFSGFFAATEVLSSADDGDALVRDDDASPIDEAPIDEAPMVVSFDSLLPVPSVDAVEPAPPVEAIEDTQPAAEVYAASADHLDLDFDLGDEVEARVESPNEAPHEASIESTLEPVAAEPDESTGPIAEAMAFGATEPSPDDATPSRRPPARHDDVREIGPLTLSVALFNIYLGEADELLRVLTQDFAEWRHELDRFVSDNAMRAAHSLAGSSSTVGLVPAHDLAAAIEDVLQALWREPIVLQEDQIGRLEDGVEALRRMLHRFAAERFPDADPVRVAGLVALRHEIVGDEAVTAAPTSEPSSVQAAVALPFEPLDFGAAADEVEAPVSLAGPSPADEPIDAASPSIDAMPITVDEAIELTAIEEDDAVSRLGPVSEVDLHLDDAGHFDAITTLGVSETPFDEEIRLRTSAPPAEAMDVEPLIVEEQPVVANEALEVDRRPVPDVDAVESEAREVEAPELEAAELELQERDVREDVADEAVAHDPVPADAGAHDVEAFDPASSVDHTHDDDATFAEAHEVVASGPEVHEHAPLPAEAEVVEPVAALPSFEAPGHRGDPLPPVEFDPSQTMIDSDDASFAQSPGYLSLVSDAEALQAPRRSTADVASTVRDDIDPELLDVFVAEGGEILPQIGTLLRTWQGRPDDATPARTLLRHLHTLKGSARMAGAMRLGEVAHDIEARVESAARLHEVPTALLDELLAAHDRSLELFDRLQHPAEAAAASAPVDKLPAEATATDEVADEAKPQELPVAVRPAAPRAREQKGSQQAVRVNSETLDRLVNLAGEVSIARARIENEVHQIKSAMSDLNENVERLRGQLREIELQAEFQMQSQMQSQHAAGHEREKFDPLEFDRFTRFQELTRMMAESVNDVKTLQQHLQKSCDSAETDLASQRRMTRDLQQDLMSVRMVPFSSIAERLYRVARRAAKEVDKRVNLDIRGGSVEIDRGVLERMAGPFEHLLRNHIVHGIESRDARRAAGKPETGELLVEIRQEGNEIVLTFSDDGAGLDHRRIRAKGRELGLLDDGDISDAQAAELIFHPGFSTASEVTELAGRGVGMDVVRAEAVVLAGRVSVDSESGRGTRFTINLPLTLAITQVVLVAVAGRVYALPAVLVEQVRQLRPQPLADAYRAGHLSWAGAQVRLAFLGTLLGIDDSVPVAQRSSPVLVLRSAGERIAIHVDEVVGNQEVVVKNLGPQLSRMTGIAGATVLGSGEIVLILNPVQLAQMSRAQAAMSAVPAAVDAPPVESGASSAPVPPVAVVGTGHDLHTLPTVMVVDDSLTVRRVTQRLLSREGYQVVLAKDGVDALEQLQDFAPDVMLVDIEMPRMDGFDLTRNVRNDERFRRIPIVMITSRTAEKHRRHAADLGVDAYLGKPYQEDELLELLGTYLRAKRTQPA